ncbi:hypothetical protein HRE53_21160 [Acaryochloris sp. 'Moss Beach']|uniref:hypothetical protein n=1 Tax=Acaryochloris sp. 'Moss Beach' TaxID=2740837 RepID=UPI001F1DCC2C|nr:hypothetical protein [Acaryochloris sp. 'Moss Beach']UJB68918.1 hypothetical protein HRE53_21160 [Acaryochloris sp. 'Moss Beach']
MEHTPFTPQERVESLKAGGLSAGVATFVFAILLAINEGLAQWPIADSRLIGSWISLSGSLVSVAISGLLFGVTYRYAIRQDTNPQLKSGVVLAFSLVRGLAQVDTGFGITDTVLPFVLMAVESWVVFSCDRIVLDQSLQRGWLKPFVIPSCA